MKKNIGVGAFIEENGKILMGQKPKDVGPYPNTWHLPGGKVEDGESLYDALKREVKEETGLDVISAEPLFFSDDVTENKHNQLTHFVFLVYKTKVENSTLEALDDLKVLKWISWKEVTKLPLTKPSQDLLKFLKVT